jgi:multicomponent Na+:H+ antiporter subunit G
MPELIENIGYFCLLAGAFFLLTSAVGLWRMPDFFTRLHPAGVADSMGIPLILIGITLLSPIGIITVKILLLLIFALYTSATSCHALAKAALLSKEKIKGNVKK